MDATEQNVEEPGSKQECSSCRGRGKIRTGGCTLEHGISTSCDDFGCPPIEDKKCPVCNGKGYTNLKTT